MSRRVGFLLILASSLLPAHGNESKLLDKHYIKAKPEICVTTQDKCQVDLYLSWQGEPASSYCLEIETTELERICDIPNRAHQFKLSLEVASDVKIYLVRLQDVQRVANVSIDVQRHSLNQKRRKVAWSIF
ncbi:DUF3019 domain-containing protein [Pseudoalteromonas sp. YIC-656]|uniref:DUF3019 domain-containing protein n=1 Tax=Pseudoalteromonas pernae TaxID=3118054 RepID=UPI003242818C